MTDETLEQLPTPGRVEAFSDGVIAIAITLLVLDLKVPESGASLGAELRHQWPSYLGYATSFVTIGIMWVNHHALFDRVRRVTRSMLFANLALLLGIATLPFTTSLAAQWLRAGNDARLAVGIYCASLLVVSVTFVALWHYLARNPHLVDDPSLPGRAQRRSSIGPIAYAVATGIAALSAVGGFVACAVSAAYFVRPHRPPPISSTPAGAR